MKKFNSNSLGGGIVVGTAVFYLAKHLSGLCCVKKFNRNSWGGDYSGDGQFFIWQSLCQVYAV